MASGIYHRPLQPRLIRGRDRQSRTGCVVHDHLQGEVGIGVGVDLDLEQTPLISSGRDIIRASRRAGDLE